MWLADDDCANVPLDVEYPVTIDGLARMAYRVRPPEAVMRSIYDRLLPFTGFMNWSGAGHQRPQRPRPRDGWPRAGPARRRRPLLRRDARALRTSAGARCWIARTHFDWSRVLADRGDAAAAREHAEIAVALGEELGMDGPFGIVPRGRALLESL